MFNSYQGQETRCSGQMFTHFSSPVPIPYISMIQTWFPPTRILHFHTQPGVDELISSSPYQNLVLPGNLKITSATLYLFNLSAYWQSYCFIKVFELTSQIFITKNGLSPFKISLLLGKNIWNYSKIIISIT